MFETVLDRICKECSGQAALNIVSEISHYHRIQASPDYRRAAHHVLDTLASWGLRTELFTFPTHPNTTYWGEVMFQEWDAHAGTLHLIEPESNACRLADYREVKLSLIPRSAAFEGDCELVILDKGEEIADYEGLDVAGKLVMTNGNVMRIYALAVCKFGAAGILFDGMRNLEPVCPPMTLPDAIQYTSFWWSAEDKPCFGFALSPRHGQWLRELVREQAAQDKTVRVRASVDASLYDGSIEDVTAFIPGDKDTEQEIIITSHLCHPAPCANDNVSGVAAAMEAARALHKLIESGELPRPQRAIRFLWMPEMTGMYPYLASRESELGQIVAGLNLDMVGEDQAQTGSVMLIERPSEALPSFAPDLLARLREEFFEGKSHAGQDGFSLFRHAIIPFAGGSDHFILSDPQVNIPTPMIIQWPDKFYHTTADTIDKVDPESLWRAASLAAVYAYWIANAGAQEATWLAHELNARFKTRIIHQVQASVTQALDQPAANSRTEPHPRRVLDFMLERHHIALESVMRLGAFDVQSFKTEAQAFANSEWARCASIVGEPPAPTTDLPENAAVLVPRRVFPAQVNVRPYVRQLNETEREAWWVFSNKPDYNDHTLQTIAMYWADGKRTLAQIVDCVELETGQRKAEMLAEFFRWMEKLGLVKMV